VENSINVLRLRFSNSINVVNQILGVFENLFCLVFNKIWMLLDEVWGSFWHLACWAAIAHTCGSICLKSFVFLICCHLFEAWWVFDKAIYVYCTFPGSINSVTSQSLPLWICLTSVSHFYTSGEGSCILSILSWSTRPRLTAIVNRNIRWIKVFIKFVTSIFNWSFLTSIVFDVLDLFLLNFSILHKKILWGPNLEGNWILNITQRYTQLTRLPHVFLFNLEAAAKWTRSIYYCKIGWYTPVLHILNIT
jgi:hypothetical protein